MGGQNLSLVQSQTYRNLYPENKWHALVARTRYYLTSNSMTLVLSEAQTYSNNLIHSQLRVENTTIKVVNFNIQARNLKGYYLMSHSTTLVLRVAQAYFNNFVRSQWLGLLSNVPRTRRIAKILRNTCQITLHSIPPRNTNQLVEDH